jgi:hypothetical protein
MSYPINYPTPQGANIQILYKTDDWVKPQGASFVWFTLIGGGGSGFIGTSGIYGGGSAAVTNYMGPAFLIPDVLRVNVAAGGVGALSGIGTDGGATSVVYQQKDGTGYTLLSADGGGAGTGSAAGAGGVAMTGNYFTCMGFFQSVAGQDSGSGNISASATTFLSAGAGGSGNNVTTNYGYPQLVVTAQPGFFLMQPIIVGSGGASGGASGGGKGGIGCGGGSANNGRGGNGGNGLVVIITW